MQRLTQNPATRAIFQAAKRNYASTSRTIPSAAYTHPTGSEGASTSSTPRDITQAQRDSLDAALRIDQAGEVAANYIYMGQLAVLGRDRVAGPLIQVGIPHAAHRMRMGTHAGTLRTCGTRKRNISR